MSEYSQAAFGNEGGQDGGGHELRVVLFARLLEGVTTLSDLEEPTQLRRTAQIQERSAIPESVLPPIDPNRL